MNNIYNTYLEIFVNNLKSILQLNKILNKDFFKICNISSGFFYSIKKLENASFLCYVRIAEALNLPLQILFIDQSDWKIVTGIVPLEYTEENALHTLINCSDKDIRINIKEINDENVLNAANVYLNFFVENIKIILSNKEISQTKLAKHIGVTQAYINNIINRKQIPSIYLMIDIANYLNVSLFDLLNVPEKFQLGVQEQYKRYLFKVICV